MQKKPWMPKRTKSSTPDIALPSIGNKDWASIKRILFIDESLNDSGAALFVDGKYVEQKNENNIDIGFALTLPAHASKTIKLVKYHDWVTGLIHALSPDLVVGESHPFARGNAGTSIATLETMAGIRYITMLLASIKKIPYADFSASSVKLVMCGGSTASKEMVQLVLTGCGYKLPEYDKKPGVINGNVCDAIAIGEVICRMQKQEILRREYIQSVGEGRPQTRTRRK